MRPAGNERGNQLRCPGCISVDGRTPAYPGSIYQRLKTYLCELLGGEAKPGFEPEPEHAGHYSIVEAKWFDLRSEADWDTRLINDSWIYLPLRKHSPKIGLFKSNNRINIEQPHIPD